MISYEVLQQMERILGRDEFSRALGLPTGDLPTNLTAEQRVAIDRLIEASIDEFVQAMLKEAAACDDVVNAATAIYYVEERLSFLGELVKKDQRRRVRNGFERFASRWG